MTDDRNDRNDSTSQPHTMSQNPSVERDGAIAALMSILDPAAFPFEDYVAALDKADGDISKAAETLLVGLPEGSTPTRRSSSGETSDSSTKVRLGRTGKRSRSGGLEGWLQRPSTQAKRRWKDDGSSSIPTSPRRSSSPPCSRPSTLPDNKASAASWAAILKPSTFAPAKPMYVREPTLHLGTPAAIAAHNVPLAMLQSPLSPSMAAALYHTMMEESASWPRNKWFLAGREVESNHQSTTYKEPDRYDARVDVQYFYNSRRFETRKFPPLLAKAAEMVEEVVNAYLDSRPRYPLEYSGRWRANTCGANRYDGAAATVGWHADQVTYLGPHCTIASLSLGTPRSFRVRPVETVDQTYAVSKSTRSYEVTLGHNSLCLMTAGCQERYKHTVPPQRSLDIFRPTYDIDQNPIQADDQKPHTSRINITFRFYRPDFHPLAGEGPGGRPRMGTPVCKCGVPTLLRADQKAKARARHGSGPMSQSSTVTGDISSENTSQDSQTNSGEPNRRSLHTRDGTTLVDDDMVYFWQCQSPGTTGDLKGCGFFKLLDMRGEGRGPCFIDDVESG